MLMYSCHRNKDLYYNIEVQYEIYHCELGRNDPLPGNVMGAGVSIHLQSLLETSVWLKGGDVAYRHKGL